MEEGEGKGGLPYKEEYFPFGYYQNKPARIEEERAELFGETRREWRGYPQYIKGKTSRFEQKAIEPPTTRKEGEKDRRCSFKRNRMG